MSSAHRRSAPSVWRVTVVIVAAVPFVYPLLFIVGTAVKTPADYVSNHIGFPHEFSLYNLRYAWNTAQLGPATINSLICVTTGVVVALLLSSTSAYWFLRHRGRLGRALMAIVVGCWVLPIVVWIIPLFISMSRQGLVDNLYVLGVVYGVMNAPFGVYLLHTFYSQAIPAQVLEAAALDGASIWQTYQRVIIPLSRPALGSLAALSFLWTWGDLLLAVVLIQNANHLPVTVVSATLVTKYNAAIQPQAAAAVITMVPVLIVFLLAQRSIVRGLTAGVGKD